MTPTQTPAPAQTTGLITLDEYVKLPNDGPLTELVRGRIVQMPPTYPYHGILCNRIAFQIQLFLEKNDLGWLLTNDSGVVTERDPGTLRGADVAFYSYSRIPKGPFPQHAYLTVVPELVVEVRSPSDRWSKVLAKTAEYLAAGVTIVCIVDPDTQTVQVYRDALPLTLHGDDELTLADVLPGFHVPVRRFFE